MDIFAIFAFGFLAMIVGGAVLSIVLAAFSRYERRYWYADETQTQTNDERASDWQDKYSAFHDD